MCGDWKQLLPVVPGASEYAQLDASVKNSDFFQRFETFRLTQNMRVGPAEVTYRKYLKQIGCGTTVFGKDQIELPAEMCSENLEDVIDFVFPAHALADPTNHMEELNESALLCPTNKESLDINNKIMVSLIIKN
jgi:hypothetical protein